MLNRRLLRSKAVQALYAYRIATDANRQLAKDEISDYYLPDLNSMLPQNLAELEEFKQQAHLTFDELIASVESNHKKDVPLEVLQIARNAYSTYLKQNQKDIKIILKRVLNETRGIFNEYLLVLALLLELAHQAKQDRERKIYITESAFPSASGLDTNSVIRLLTESKELELEIIRSGISWANDQSVVRKTYREALRADLDYTDYCKKNIHTAEEDQQIVQHILRQLILKHEVPVDYFEQKDINWEEHFDFIRSMAIKTLKSAATGKVELAELTDDWEEDSFFVEELVQNTIKNDTQFEDYLFEQLKNWDLDRIAMMDMIIMKVALTEMIQFSSIPVKVTINEFIEIAKRYSTLKSGKFVNGNLDKLAEKLKEQGIIRKSGRGLIDNR